MKLRPFILISQDFHTPVSHGLAILGLRMSARAVARVSGPAMLRTEIRQGYWNHGRQHQPNDRRQRVFGFMSAHASRVTTGASAASTINLAQDARCSKNAAVGISHYGNL